MSTTKTREQLVRLSWITELRRQGDRKCTGDMAWEGKVCALGLLAEVAGIRVRDDDLIPPYDLIGRAGGLSAAKVAKVWQMNDGDTYTETRQHTFAEIADVVAAWFPST